MSARFRWKLIPRCKEGDRRTVCRFLWWPKCINGETRWLGYERIREECYAGWEGLEWYATRWADK